MELFKIVTDKEELKKRCLEVETPISEELKTLLLKMIDYLKKSQDDEFAKKAHNVVTDMSSIYRVFNNDI